MDKSHIWKNAHCQSDCRIFKSAISLEQNDEKKLIFCMIIQVHWNHGHKWVCPLWSQDWLYLTKKLMEWAGFWCVDMMSHKIWFFGYFEKLPVTSFSWKQSKIKTNIVMDISSPIPYLVKFWISSYEPVKLQDSLKCNNSRKKWSVFLAWR